MILKQRFADGRTNYKDIGNDFMYVQKQAEDFDMWANDHKLNDSDRKSCLGFILWERKYEPVFEDFPQWIYANDGQLFMTLTNGVKSTSNENKLTLKDWQHILHKMDYYKSDNGAIMKTPDGSYTVSFNIVHDVDYGDKYITREYVLKMIGETNS